MVSKKIHVLQHVEVEGPAYIKEWANAKGVSLSYTYFYENYEIPSPDAFDLLVVMGGPMGVNDTVAYPWILEERAFIKQCIEINKPILGICLGSQFLAKACGSSVYRNTQPEIGWFPLTLSENNTIPSSLKAILPSKPEVFHWHGDTFDIPTKAIHLYSSSATPNQAFLIEDKIIALQFHLEATNESLRNMTDTFADHLVESEFVQDAESIISQENLVRENNQIMANLLSYLLAD